MSKLLITGCSGFVGRNMVKHFLEKGYEVAGLARSNPNIAGLDFYPFDMRTDAVPVKFQSYDIIHCAAMVSDTTESLYESSLVNILGTEKMLHVNPNHSFIHISSSSIYNLSSHSNQADELSFDPENMPRYYNTYSATKALTESLILSQRVPRSLQPISLRPHAVYGEDDTTLIPKVLKQVKHGQIRLPGGGKNFHTLTNIRNLIHAAELALKYHPSQPEAFNITDSNAVQLKEAISTASSQELKFKKVSTSLLLLLPEAITNISEYQIRQLGFDRTYSTQKAVDLLNYRPEPFQMEWL